MNVKRFTARTSREALSQVQPLADETVCLSVPPGFQAVAQFYAKFPQVSDDDVAHCLQGHDRLGSRPGQPSKSGTCEKPGAAASRAASKG